MGVVAGDTCCMRTESFSRQVVYVGVSCNHEVMTTPLEARAQRNLAAIFRAERARLNIDQADLAKAVGTTQATVSRKLTNRSSFNAIELALYCKALGLDVTETLTLAMSNIDQDAIEGAH